MQAGLPALVQAAAGFTSNLRALESSAAELARGHGRRGEPAAAVEPLVAGIVAARATDASAAVLGRADEALGSLIDTFA